MSVTLEYMGDLIGVEDYKFQQNILILTFTNVASILDGKLPGGKSEITLTIKGQLQGGGTFSGTCPLLVQVPPGSVNMADLVPLDKTQEDGPRANDVLIAEPGLSAEVEEQAPVQEDAGSSTGEPETNPGQGHLDQNIGDEGRENLTEDSEGQRAVEENSEIPQQQSGGEQEAEPGPESSFPPIE